MAIVRILKECFHCYILPNLPKSLPTVVFVRSETLLRTTNLGSVGRYLGISYGVPHLQIVDKFP